MIAIHSWNEALFMSIEDSVPISTHPPQARPSSSWRGGASWPLPSSSPYLRLTHAFRLHALAHRFALRLRHWSEGLPKLKA